MMSLTKIIVVILLTIVIVALFIGGMIRLFSKWIRVHFKPNVPRNSFSSTNAGTVILEVSPSAPSYHNQEEVPYLPPTTCLSKSSFDDEPPSYDSLFGKETHSSSTNE